MPYPIKEVKGDYIMNNNYNPYENNDFDQQETFNQNRPLDQSYRQDQYSGYLPVPMEPKKKSGAGRMVALALCCSLLGGIVGASGAIIGTAALKGDTPASAVIGSTVLEGDRAVLNVAHVDTGSELTPAEIYAQNVNSTVGITTSITTNFFGYQTTSAASGSGFILTSDGYIVTNYHVVDSANTVKVTMYDGTAYDAVIVGYDESNDVAVLKIDAHDLTPVVLGSSSDLNVGDYVVAIGNPLGELTFSLTHGAVSALDRDITMSSGTSMTLIQTDCAINSGNSGGALFNMHGEVVGITNAKYSSSGSIEASIDNIGFAIPIDSVRSIITSIIEKGYVSKPYIGVSIENVSEDMQGFGLPKGAVIRGVTEGAPAANAGLQVNDIVTAVNGEEIDGSSGLKAAVSAAEIGDVLRLAVYRQGETFELDVTVGEQKATQSEQSSGSQQDNGYGYGYGYDFPWGRLFGF